MLGGSDHNSGHAAGEPRPPVSFVLPLEQVHTPRPQDTWEQVLAVAAPGCFLLGWTHLLVWRRVELST